MSARDRLLVKLVTGYHAALNPETSELTYGASPLFVHHDKGHHELTIAVFEYHSWKDSRLTWNPADYDGVKTLRIPARLVWIPDTRLYSSVPAILDRDADINVLVSSDGTVLFVPRANYRIPCQETSGGQLTGTIKVGSWTYTKVDLPLKLYKEGGLDLDYFDSTSPYTITSHSAKIVNLKFDEDAYPAIEISITVKHRTEH